MAASCPTRKSDRTAKLPLPQTHGSIFQSYQTGKNSWAELIEIKLPASAHPNFNHDSSNDQRRFRESKGVLRGAKRPSIKASVKIVNRSFAYPCASKELFRSCYRQIADHSFDRRDILCFVGLSEGAFGRS